MSTKPEFDLMGDGYARGFTGDSFLIRQRYRTAHALAYHTGDQGDPKIVCGYFDQLGCPPIINDRGHFQPFINEALSKYAPPANPKREKEEPIKVPTIDISDIDF